MIPMTLADVAHFIQRHDDVLLDYHPWDETAEPCEDVLSLPPPDSSYDEGTP